MEKLKIHTLMFWLMRPTTIRQILILRWKRELVKHMSILVWCMKCTKDMVCLSLYWLFLVRPLKLEQRTSLKVIMLVDTFPSFMVILQLSWVLLMQGILKQSQEERTFLHSCWTLLRVPDRIHMWFMFYWLTLICYAHQVWLVMIMIKR